MPSTVNKIIQGQVPRQLAIFFFIVLSVWWVISFFILGDKNNLIWGASYQIVAIVGAIYGFIVSQQWGGFKSLLGRSILFFSLGLAFQTLGQSAFSFYNLVAKVGVPYPSIADIGYFGSIPLYIYAATLLLKISGGALSLKSSSNRIISVTLLVGMLFFSYLFFLQKYEFDWSSPLRIVLDFGYPLGQAIYVSIAVLTYILSRKYLGGVMRSSLLTILIALLVQYIADYNFLYQALHETWINGGYGDFLYLLSYLLLTLGLIKLGNVFHKITSPSQ